MEIVHLTYRCAVTGRILRMESYQPPKPYGLRGYARDLVGAVALLLSASAIAVAGGTAVLLMGW